MEQSVVSSHAACEDGMGIVVFARVLAFAEPYNCSGTISVDQTHLRHLLRLLLWI